MADQRSEILILEWYKGLYHQFYKTYHHQIWQAAKSSGVDSYVTNKADTSDISTLKSRDFEILF